MVKNQAAMWEIWVQFLGQEDALVKGMATCSVSLPEEFHGQRSLVGFSPWGRKESDVTKKLTHLYFLLCHPMPQLPPGNGYFEQGT